MEILVFHFPSVFIGPFAILVLTPFAASIPKFKVYAVLWLFLLVLPVGFLIRSIANRLSLARPLLGFLWRVGFLSVFWIAALVVMIFLAHSAVWGITGYGGGPLPLDMFAFKVFAKAILDLLPVASISCVVFCFLGSLLIRSKQFRVRADA